MKHDIEDGIIILIQDGWSNINNNPVIGCSLHTGRKAYLLNINGTGFRKEKC